MRTGRLYIQAQPRGGYQVTLRKYDDHSTVRRRVTKYFNDLRSALRWRDHQGPKFFGPRTWAKKLRRYDP